MLQQLLLPSPALAEALAPREVSAKWLPQQQDRSPGPAPGVRRSGRWGRSEPSGSRRSRSASPLPGFSASGPCIKVALPRSHSLFFPGFLPPCRHGGGSMFTAMALRASTEASLRSRWQNAGYRTLAVSEAWSRAFSCLARRRAKLPMTPGLGPRWPRPSLTIDKLCLADLRQTLRLSPLLQAQAPGPAPGAGAGAPARTSRAPPEQGFENASGPPNFCFLCPPGAPP